jgi:hypothetical protein
MDNSIWSRNSSKASGERFCFLPHGGAILVQQGEFFDRRQDFYTFDLAIGRMRQLSKLGHGFSVRSLDVSPDGKQILFDRQRENSNIVLIDLPR